MFRLTALVALSLLSYATAALASTTVPPRIPEPETLALFAAGMGAIWLSRRFRRK